MAEPAIGYEAEPADVAAFTMWTLDVRDPSERYARASADQALHHAVAVRLGAIRAAAIKELHRAGASYATIALETGLSRARVQQLAELAEASQ